MDRHDNLPRIAIVGPGECGKNEAARWFAAHTPLRFRKTTSEVIAEAVAALRRCTVEEAMANRRAERDYWLAVGNELRALDPCYLVRETLDDAEICVGIRAPVELATAKANGLLDLVIWIDRADIPHDPTMLFGSEMADVIVENHGSLACLHARLERLARFAGLA